MCGVVSVAFALPLLVATSSAASPLVTSLDLIILVDESASLNSADVQGEIQAVSKLVARRELSGESLTTRVAIAGFGSGEAAVDEKCPPVIVTTENVQDLTDCAKQVRRRTSSGQHTDFAKAFAYASETFRKLGTSSAARVVILLTDGKYDPFGKRSSSGLTVAEQDALDASTTALRDDKAQIWPLGFGQVERDELDELASKGASTSCPTGRPPYAIVAADQSLDGYLLEILGATICIDVDPEEIIPVDLDVHPFVNEVTLTVRGTLQEPNVLVVETNKLLCAGEWKQAEDGSLACSVEVSGADTGIWRITSESNVPGEAPTVETSQSGRVDLRLSACEETSATVTVSRIDNTDIVWNTTEKFPRVAISDALSSEEIASTVLTDSNRIATFPSSGFSEIKVALASGQSDFVWLTASVDTCEVIADPPLTVPESSISPTEPGDSGDVDDPTPWWLLALLVGLAAAVVAWLLRRRSQGSKFPEGTELSQRNVAQNPAANWSIRADLTGLREIRFNVDRNGWLIEAEQDQADIIVRRLRSRTEGDFVVVQPARGGEGVDTQEGVRAAHAFSVAGESGAGILIRNTYIRVEVPEEIEEDEEENDEE